MSRPPCDPKIETRWTNIECRGNVRALFFFFFFFSHVARMLSSTTLHRLTLEPSSAVRSDNIYVFSIVHCSLSLSLPRHCILWSLSRTVALVSFWSNYRCFSTRTENDPLRKRLDLHSFECLCWLEWLPERIVIVVPRSLTSPTTVPFSMMFVVRDLNQNKQSCNDSCKRHGPSFNILQVISCLTHLRFKVESVCLSTQQEVHCISQSALEPILYPESRACGLQLQESALPYCDVSDESTWRDVIISALMTRLRLSRCSWQDLRRSGYELTPVNLKLNTFELSANKTCREINLIQYYIVSTFEYVGEKSRTQCLHHWTHVELAINVTRSTEYDRISSISCHYPWPSNLKISVVVTTTSTRTPVLFILVKVTIRRSTDSSGPVFWLTERDTDTEVKMWFQIISTKHADPY